jgi:hypothetical protein
MECRERRGLSGTCWAEDTMADNKNDPAEIWRTMVGEMEKGFNTFANQAMASPEFSKVVNQAGSVSAGAQKQMGDMMEKYLTGMNLPSRAQMTNFGERLAAIESQMSEVVSILRDMHQAAGGVPIGDATPRPPRTKRPPSNEGEGA